MKIQVALDVTTIEEALDILEQVNDVIEIAEIGTGTLLKFGIETIKRVKNLYPDLTVLADAKIVDGGEHFSNFLFDAGADMVTVMGFTNTETVLGAIKSAKNHQKECCVDMMRLDDIENLSNQFIEQGANYVCVHNASDALDIESTIQKAERVTSSVGGKYLSIAGGINPNTIVKTVICKPEIIVVGRAVTKAQDKRAEVLKLKENFTNALNKTASTTL